MKKYTIRSYTPAFIDDGIGPPDEHFDNLEELLNVSFVKRWSKDPNFHKFSIIRDGYNAPPCRGTLKAEMKNGTHWTIGFLDSVEALSKIPAFNIEECEEREKNYKGEKLGPCFVSFKYNEGQNFSGDKS